MILCPTVWPACVVWIQTGSVQPQGEVKQRVWHAPVYSQDPTFVLWSNPKSFCVQVLSPPNASHICMLACASSLFKHCLILQIKAWKGTFRIPLFSPENISPYVFISVIRTMTIVIMSTETASLRIPFSTSHTWIGRCLSLLFQLYFSRLRCRRGTCFLDNAVVISPFFQVPLIWTDMKTLHVYLFFPT